MLRFISLFLSFAFFGCGRAPDSSQPLYVDDSSAGVSVALVGDSISTGIFASTKLGSWPKNLAPLFGAVFARLKFDINTKRFAQAFVEEAHQVNDEAERDHRAISTNANWGLRHALAQAHGVDDNAVKWFLSARFGAKLKDAPDLIKALVAQYKAEGMGFHASHAVMMLGANDFCADLSADDLRQKLDSAIGLMVTSHPDTRIVVAAIPPITDMKSMDCHYSVDAEFSIDTKVFGGKKRAVRQKIPVLDGVSCDDFRHLYCEPLYAKDADKKLAALNAMFAAVTAAWAERPGMHVSFADGIATMTLTKDHIAFDGFHPSEDGQKLIAKTLLDPLLK